MSAARVATRAFGAAQVAEIGQGTWQMEGDDRAACVRALRRGLDLGLTHVDTAEMYGRGEVEHIVAEAIEGRRDEVFLVSKVLPSNASYAGTKRACEASLKRLGTDRLDAYLLHWPGSHPLDETIRAFDDLVREGKIRAWGVSNFDVDDLEEAARLAPGGATSIACNQVLYHLEQRAIEHRVAPWCAKNGVAVVAYSPFGAGRFPARDATLAAVAKKHGVTTHAVALRFLLRLDEVLVIPKAASAAHVEANAAAAHLALDADDLARIDRAFPAARSRGLPTL